MKQISKLWLYSGALFFPAIFAAVVAQVILLSGQPESSQVWFYPGLLIGVIVGTVCLALLPIQSKWIKYIAVVVYFPLMLCLAWVAGFTSVFASSEFCC